LSDEFCKILSELEKVRDGLLDEASESKWIPDTLYLTKLAYKLQEVIPLKHPMAEEEKPDILHGRWAEALMAAFYCGCISQQKAVRPKCGDYNRIRDLIGRTLVAAFEEGVEYASEREKKKL
jgi:hypothetical protein